jgi:hypothetical protein
VSRVLYWLLRWLHERILYWLSRRLIERVLYWLLWRLVERVLYWLSAVGWCLFFASGLFGFVFSFLGKLWADMPGTVAWDSQWRSVVFKNESYGVLLLLKTERCLGVHLYFSLLFCIIGETLSANGRSAGVGLPFRR